MDGGTGVGVHTLARGGQPLLVADLADGVTAAALEAALEDAGLVRLPGFLGVDLPQGARVGIQLEGREVRLVDERDATLLRLTRSGLAADWQRAAVARRGTVLVVARGLGVGPEAAPPELGAALETTARDGRLLAAVVGVHDRPPRLPLLL
ncbi:MAG: hypothetical protein ACO4BW_02025 [Nitriliruptoraceae bacterium]